MYTKAELYDLIARGMEKDFTGQADRVADLVRQAGPDSRTLLDVACGTGERARYHYIIECPDGTREADEIDEWGLFTVDEMLAASSAVGMMATYNPNWSDDPVGRGVYVASVPA